MPAYYGVAKVRARCVFINSPSFRALIRPEVHHLLPPLCVIIGEISISPSLSQAKGQWHYHLQLKLNMQGYRTRKDIQ